MKLSCGLIKASARKKMPMLAGGLFALLLITGCASTEVTNQRNFVTGPLPRPGNILVYDFAATAADLPADSALAGHPDVDTTPQAAGQVAAGRLLGIKIAAELVGRIHGMGMPVQRNGEGMQPQINDLVIRGCFISINEGSAAKRICIGFGSGASELKVAVETYQMTAQGLRKLGSNDVQGKGSKAPGVSLGLAALLVTANPVTFIVGSGVKVYNEASGRNKVEGRARQIAKEIAAELKIRFQEQCWIN
jgi:hypothetical protein